MKTMKVMYCNDCSSPRGAISQSGRPLGNNVKVNDGSKIRCAVCGSSNVRKIKVGR